MPGWFDVSALWPALYEEARTLLTQPGVPSVTLLVAVTGIATLVAVVIATLTSLAQPAVGNGRSLAQTAFGLYVSYGRLKNLLCSPFDRCRQRYPVPLTCQIPFFTNISDVYTFIWGYKADGLFVEVGAYDGESFSNTSGLADLGWKGIYCEPIPRFAAACRARHAGNPEVSVHEVCVGETDGLEVDISTAGPFSSAVEDEVETVSASNLNGALRALGWSHTDAAASKVRCTTQTLHTFLTKNAGLSPVEPAELPSPRPRRASSAGSAARQRRGGAAGSSSAEAAAIPAHGSGHSRAGSSNSATQTPGGDLLPSATASAGTSAAGGAGRATPIDLLVIDVEGLEWPILRSFPIAAWRPSVVIIEIQELQARYRGNARVQGDAAALFAYFKDAGYSILYKDVVNTVFVHKELEIRGGA